MHGLTLLVALLVPVAPAGAFHRQSPPVSVVVGAGDTTLPRLPAMGNRIALVVGGQILRHQKEKIREHLEVVTAGGDPRNPTIAKNGIVAWDDDCPPALCAHPGRQIFKADRYGIAPVTDDPTGTSRNPALNARGNTLAFESRGDLAGGTAAVGPPQVFLRRRDGSLVQVSRGAGTSGNAALGRSGRDVVFESTSNPVTGADTGIGQVWLFTARGTLVLSDGLAPSGLPAISGDGKFVAFESRAALASGTGAGDGGVPQIFGRDLRTDTRYQITAAPGGCAGPSVDKVGSDWRVGFTCGGVGYVHLVRANTRVALPVSGGDTARAVTELGTHFVVVSTTGAVDVFGPSPGHRIYLLNLYKLPGLTVPSDAVAY